MTTPVAAVQSVQLDDEQNALILLDQTLLPNEKVFLQLTKVEAIWEAIYQLKVRGAPAIGTGIITEKGIAYPPYQESLAHLRTKD